SRPRPRAAGRRGPGRRPVTERVPVPEVHAATVLISSRDRPEMLAETVASVLAGKSVPSELLVVDQSARPHEQLAQLGEVRGCAVRYLQSDSRGLSRARNIGLRAAANEVVVLIDDDMFVQRDWLAALLAAMPADPLAVVTGRVLPAPDEGTGGEVPPAALVTRATPAVYRGRQPTDVVAGANVALHRATVLGLGGYDERLGAGTRFASADDNDIGLRLLDAGCEVRHVPEAVVLHRAWRTRGRRMRMRWDYGRGKGAFYVKHMRRGDAYTRARMRADARRRVRLALAALPRSPQTAGAQSVYLAGMIAGAVEWQVREQAGRARRRAPPD
ncbi:MAG TPA: glycosyltransferase, partial [Solirubrobacteraceae bacterium]|nr:glycosyltransferase [Solirubrobacteraceae bacterium]